MSYALKPLDGKHIKFRAARCSLEDLRGHKRLISAEVHLAPMSSLHGADALAAWRWGWEMGLEKSNSRNALNYHKPDLQHFCDEGYRNGFDFRFELEAQ